MTRPSQAPSFGDFFFTEPDDELQQTGSRDPLGFEVLWTHFAGRMIPHFSTVSRGATNFGVCLTLIWLVDSYIDAERRRDFVDGTRTRPLRDGLLIVAETLSVLSVLESFGQDLESGVLGSFNGRRKLEADGPVWVGPFANQQLLSRQLNLGVFGRYRGALHSMGLLDERTHIAPEAESKLEPAFKTLAPLQHMVHRFFDEVMKANGHQVRFARFDSGAVELMASLRREEARTAFAPVLLGAAGVNPGADTLLRRIYERVTAEDTSAADANRRILQLEDELDDPDEVARVADVRRLEELLLRFDGLFDHLWSVDRVTATETAPFVDELQQMRPELHTLLERTSTTGYTRRRLEALDDVLGHDNPVDVVNALVSHYHRDTVASSRGASPWVEVNGDRVTVLNEGYAAPAGLESRGWRRSYYVPTVAGFKRGIEEVYPA